MMMVVGRIVNRALRWWGMSEMDRQIDGTQRRVAMEQLAQIYTHGPVEDGDLIGKWYRTWLVQRGYVRRFEGFNVITPKGREVMERQ